MRISDWSSDVCSSDLVVSPRFTKISQIMPSSMEFCSMTMPSSRISRMWGLLRFGPTPRLACPTASLPFGPTRSEEHTSELQSLMRISYAVFCLKKKNIHQSQPPQTIYQHKSLTHTLKDTIQ